MKVVEAKVVVLGSNGVGKTSLVVRYIGKMYSKHISPTIGASFFTCNLNIDDSRVKLQIWDTAGQERFRSMAPMYYRKANAALLVFDICNPRSFEAMKGWVSELQSNVPESIVMSVVGNKSDLAESRTVSQSEAASYADSVGADYFETSALRDHGIEEVFVSTAKSLLSVANLYVCTSLRSYDSLDGETERLPIGRPTEEEATHMGRVELPVSDKDIKRGEPTKSVCC